MLNERSSRREPTIVSFCVEEKILAHAATRLRTVIILLLETGLRIGKECLPLEWSDIDFQAGRITVGASKSIAGRRTLPLSNRCKANLVAWRSLVQNTSRYVFFNPADPSKPLKSVKKTWSTTLKKAGVPAFPIYSLRATFASRLSAVGVPDGFVSQLDVSAAKVH
jgi:integrase